jgi:hypothetical protein
MERNKIGRRLTLMNADQKQNFTEIHGRSIRADVHRSAAMIIFSLSWCPCGEVQIIGIAEPDI